MAQADKFNQTVASIYAAVTGASSWSNALIAVEDFTGSTGAVLDLVPLNGALPRTFAGSFSQENCADYASNYQSICPRIAFASAHLEIPTHFDQLILSEREMDHDPVYEWFGSHGLRYFVGGSAGITSQYLVYFSLQRSRRQGHAQAQDIDAFDLIRPHLAQAVAIADSLDTLAAHRRFSDAMLDALPWAIFGLDCGGSLLFANSSGEKLLQRGDMLTVEAGRLVAAIRSQRSQFNTLIDCALTGRPGGAMRLCRTDGLRPCAVRVSPIEVEQAERFLRPAALVIVTDPTFVAAPDLETLRALYGLTPAEAKTAVALVGGHSIQSAAQLLGVSGETLRSHLKALFRKIGVSRQQDLVRILTGMDLRSITCPLPSPE